MAPVDARVLGRAYEKQVDVVIARWDRGPKLLVSTKAQLSSFGKNLPNRFEEAYGDAGTCEVATHSPLSATSSSNGPPSPPPNPTRSSAAST